MNRRNTIGYGRAAGQRNGFTLVELLVVIGMIALLISILLPALSQVRLRGQSAVCQSNLRQIGVVLMLYGQDNRGWIYPVGAVDTNAADIGTAAYNRPTTLGTEVNPGLRWPAVAFHTTFTDVMVCPSPEIMKCPVDYDNDSVDHSYVLNQHLSNNLVMLNTGKAAGLFDTQIIVMGEKKAIYPDYYMEVDDFDRLADSYRHGLMYGSNYLFLDWHVSPEAPDEAKGAMDPWDVPANAPATQP